MNYWRLAFLAQYHLEIVLYYQQSNNTIISRIKISLEYLHSPSCIRSDLVIVSINVVLTPTLSILGTIGTWLRCVAASQSKKEDSYYSHLRMIARKTDRIKISPNICRVDQHSWPGCITTGQKEAAKGCTDIDFKSRPVDRGRPGRDVRILISSTEINFLSHRIKRPSGKSYDSDPIELEQYFRLSFYYSDGDWNCLASEVRCETTDLVWNDGIWVVLNALTNKLKNI